MTEPGYCELARMAAEGQTGEAREIERPNFATLIDYIVDMTLDPALMGRPFKAYSVIVPPGKSILEHEHEEDVVVFYAQHSTIIVDGDEKHPRAGEFTFIPAGVRHSVPRNESKSVRVSIALKIRRPEGDKSTNL